MIFHANCHNLNEMSKPIFWKKYLKLSSDEIFPSMLNDNILVQASGGKTGVYMGIDCFFLFLLENIDCGYSLEPPRRGSSNEYTQSIF